MQIKNSFLSGIFNKVLLLCMLAMAGFIMQAGAQVTVTATAGVPAGSYTTLKGAFDAINAGNHQGDITININANTTEGTTPATLHSSDAEPAAYSSVLIRPTIDNAIISGNPAAGLGVIQLNGADNVTISGDNPNTGGTNRNLTINNTNTAAAVGNSVIRIATSALVSSADNINILFCNINGNVTAGNASGITSSTSSSNISFGIYVGGNGGATEISAPTAITTSMEAAPSGSIIKSLNIQNNSINQCGRGIMYNGADVSNSNGISITSNLIGTVSALGSFPYTTPTTTVYTYGIWVAGTTSLSIASNQIRNIISYVAAPSAGIELASAIGTGSVDVSSNIISGIIINNAGAYQAAGISVSSAGDVITISNNTISKVECGSASTTLFANGIKINSTPATALATIQNNQITSIFNRHTGGYAAHGISITSAANGCVIQNNFVSDVMNYGETSYGNLYNANGIFLGAGNAHKVYFNSVNLFGNDDGTTTNSINCLAINANTQTGIDIRNNIFSNTITSGGASKAFTCIFLPFTVNAGMNLTINNNAYYTGADATKNFIGFANNAVYNLANLFTVGNFDPLTTAGATNWRTISSAAGVGGNDYASFGTYAAAPFVSATNLHIVTVPANQLESGGIPVGVPLDIDGQVRNVNFPDIGADEFVGTRTDLTPPLMVYTPLGNICTVGARTLNVTITDPAGVPTAGAGLPVLYWRINALPYVAATANSMGFGVYQFTFGAGAVFPDVVSYYIVAQDGAGNVIADPSAGATGYSINPPAAATPPTTPNSYTMQNVLAPGTYTVGVGIGPNYPTITAAVNAYNTSCPGGAIIFELLDVNYNSETYPITIANTLASSTNTLTIRPAPGITVLQNGSNATTLFKLNGADYITLDGLNTGGSSWQINNTLSSAQSVIWIASASATDGATNNNIRNLRLIGGGTSSSISCIIAGNGTTLGNPAAAANSNNTISGNTLKSAQNGIFISGVLTGFDQGWNINNNSFGGVPGAEKLGYRGLSLQGVNNFNVSNNTIAGIVISSASPATGIAIFNNATNGSISKNRISDVRQNNTTGASHGIFLQSSVNASNVVVDNNFIWDIFSVGSATVANNATGIFINTGGGYNIYYNSINISAGATGSTSITSAMRISNGVTISNALNVRNNIFTNTTAVGTRYCIYNASTAGIFSNIDYNDYYNNSTTTIGFLTIPRNTLADWQAATGKDVRSVSIIPGFVSATDLHLIPASYLNALAITIAGFTTDIDNDARTATPDIGADEFVAVNCSGTPSGGTITASALTFCISGSAALSATGYAPGNGLTYQWEWSTNAFGTANNLAGQTLPSNANTGVISATTSYRLKVICTLSGQTGYSNVITITVNSPVVSTTTPASRCGTGTVNLGATTVTPGAALNWYAASTGGTSLFTGSPFTTPVIAATTTYYVSASVGGSSGSVGPVSPADVGGGSGGFATFNTFFMSFNVLEATTLQSVDVFPEATGFNMTMLLRNSSGATLATINYTTTVSGGSTPQTVPINFVLAPGTGYTLINTNFGGGRLWRNTTGAAYPYTSSAINITGNNVGVGFYYFFYNWQFSSTCNSPRTAVTATVNAAPAITSATATPAALCAGSSSSLNVTSGNAGYTYVWNPGALPGATVSVSPASNTQYTVTATDVSGGAFNGCATTQDVLVTVSPLPGTVTVNLPGPINVCIGATATQLTASGGALNNVTALTENFNAASNGWTTINNTTGGTPANTAWTLRPNGYSYPPVFNSNDASQFYLSNSDAGGSSNQTDTRLQSPAFSLTGYTTVNLSFWHFYRHISSGAGTVEASTDGSTWAAVPGGTYAADAGAANAFVNANLNMNTYAGQPVVYLRFRLTGTYGWYWAIDNVLINGTQSSAITWSQLPVGPNSMFTDAGASIAYTGGPTSTIYVQPGVNTVYTATATGPAPSSCTRSATSTFTVTPAVSVTIVASQNPICPATSVTFTATPTNGGPSPSYQWQVNGANVGSNIPTYTTSGINNNDNVQVIMTGNGACTFGNPAGSNIINMTVTAPQAVGVSISAAPGNFICAGTSVTFTATPTNGGASPTYVWRLNGGVVGSNIPTYTTTTLANGDQVTCTITSNALCITGSNTAISNQILMTVNAYGPTSVVIGIFNASTTVCAGTQVTVRATPTNPGLTPNYEFFLNNVSVQTGVSNDYVFTPVNGDMIRVTLTSNYTCLTGSPTAMSNTLTMTVVAAAPASVTLNVSATLCLGVPITFTAAPTNGGPAPMYNFLLNGSTIQNSASNVYTLNTPANGNTVQVILTSSFACATNNPASSTVYSVTLNPSPTVTIAANCTNILTGSGQQATLTATAAGPTPATVTGYQWQLGGSNIGGATAATYTTAVAGTYTVIVTNSNSCPTTSNSVVITSTTPPLAGGTYIIPSTSCTGFDKISSAVTYINSNGIAGAVIFAITPAYTETAPAGGFAITATGTAVNTITFQRDGAGANPVITAGLNTAGSNIDAIFKIIGGDYITIRELNMQENAGNTVTATGATNTMTEWGVALLYASTTNGPNNNTILNNTISLNKAYANSFGIYSNMRHSAATPVTGADITNNTGGSNKVYGNAISNVNNPMFLLGAPSVMTPGNDIGGATGATQNIISNWGSNTVTTGATHFFGAVSSMSGIYAANQTGVNISWNTLTSSTGINVGAAAFRGIFMDFVGAGPTGTFTNSISNNRITLNNASTVNGALYEGISSANTAASAALSTFTLNIETDTISMVLNGTATNIFITSINNAFPTGTLSISSNLIRGNTSNALTGGFTGILNSGAVVNTININNNNIGDATTDAVTFSAATSGAVLGISNNISTGSSPTTLNINGNSLTRFVHTTTGTSVHTYINVSGATQPASQSISTNNISNITTNSNGAMNVISSTTIAANKTINGNIIANITAGAGAINVITTSGGTTNADISNNNIGNNLANNINGLGSVTGINLNNVALGIATVNNNIISGLNYTGAVGAQVSGINTQTPTATFNNNSINNLSHSGSGAVFGFFINGGTTINVSQNTIHTIQGTFATANTNAISCGVYIANGTTVNVFKNKLYNLSHLTVGNTATAASVIGIWAAGGNTVTISNNFVSDLKTPNSNIIDAIRGISVTSAVASTTYNIYYNSIYLNATASGTNFGTTGLFHTGNATATSAVLNLRNNIIDNESVSNGTGVTVAMRKGITALNNYAATSNNNLFFAGSLAIPGALFFDGTNTETTIAGLQTRLAARESLSITAIPVFVSTTDLHLVASSNCGLDGAAAPIAGFTDDIDNQVRDAVTPDIGADEFVGSGGGTGMWAGVNTNWMDPQNWCGQVPTATMNVTIPTGRPFYPLITNALPVVRNINVQAGGTINITGIGKLSIYGSITTAGTFNVVDGTIEMAGSAAQTITAGAFQNNNLKNLIINNASVNLAGTLNLIGKLSFTGSNRAFATAGFLVLRSSATGTASVGDITNNSVNTGNTITGDVSVERYIRAKAAWHFLSVPTQNNLQTIKQAWQENCGANANCSVGYGTQIIGEMAGWAALGFDQQSPASLPSVKNYVPASNTWIGIPNTTTAFTTGRGYMTFVRGDRSVTTLAPATTTILRDKGALVTNNSSAAPIGTNLFAAVGNPYASAVDFTKLGKTVLQDVYYLWDPQVNAYGGYVTFTKSGAIYIPTPASPSYPSGGNYFIESGQAFFVKSTGAGSTLTFTEQSKVDGSNLVSRPTGTDRQMRTNLYVLNANGASLFDGVLAEFDNSYTNGIDDADALKLVNFGENLSISRNNQRLSVERRSEIITTDTIFYHMAQMRVQNYQFEFVAENLAQPGLIGYLEDLYLNTSTIINMDGATKVDFNVVNIPGSYAPDRFRLVFVQSAQGPVPVSFTSVRAVKQQKDILVEWKVENELNIRHYEVEKSSDGRNFRKVAEELATGGSGTLIYKWLDKNPYEGDNFYRIRSVGIGSDIKLSQVVKVNMEKQPALISVYPNPVKEDGIVNINLENKPKGIYQINLLNNEGKSMMKKSLNHSGGNSVYSIRIDKFIAHGNYILLISGEDQTNLSFKIVY